MSDIKLTDFEQSFYKFVKEEFADAKNYPFYYGNVVIDTSLHDIWVYCNFSELNVGTGKRSIAYVDIITRITTIETYNKQLRSIADELRQIFVNSNINLYDCSIVDNPVIILGEKIVIMRKLKNQKALRIFERIEDLETDEVSSLLQAAQITVQMKLLKNFSGSRVV